MVNFEIKTGIILLAEPFMMDPNFRRTALLLCEHSAHGSLGFVMNRPTNSRIDELMDDFPEFDCPVFWGGPVQTDTLHYLHLAGELLADCIQVADGVYWGGAFEELKFLVRSGLILPDQIPLFSWVFRLGRRSIIGRNILRLLGSRRNAPQLPF